MRGELERPRVPERAREDVWGTAVSEWTAGHAEELRGRLRQARAAAAVERTYGRGSMDAFADEVGAGRSKVYAYAAGYSGLLEAFGTHERISERLDDSPLTISNVLEAAKEEDVPKALDEAEDGNLSSRQQKAKRKEREVPETVETIDKVACPECASIFELSRAATWTEARS